MGILQGNLYANREGEPGEVEYSAAEARRSLPTA